MHVDNSWQIRQRSSCKMNFEQTTNAAHYNNVSNINVTEHRSSVSSARQSDFDQFTISLLFYCNFVQRLVSCHRVSKPYIVFDNAPY